MSATTASDEQVVREFIGEGVDSGDPDSLSRWLHPDLEFHGGSLGEYGFDVFQKNLGKFWAAFPDLTSSIEDLAVNDDRVWVRLKVRATHEGPFAGMEASGKQVEWMDLLVYGLEDGLIVEEWALVDVPSIVAQLQA
jgi:predicted ester cyclase